MRHHRLLLPSLYPPTQDSFLFSVSIISGLACIILAVVKFMLGKVLTSKALITDGASHTLTEESERLGGGQGWGVGGCRC